MKALSLAASIWFSWLCAVPAQADGPVVWMGWAHEPDDFLLRRGSAGSGGTYGAWLPKCNRRHHSAELFDKATDLGVNLIYAHYFKGFGLEHERANMEKTREIGILRAMGVPSRSVMKVFVMVGGFIGLIGSVLGCAAGVGFCLAQMKWGFIKLPPDVYMVSVFPIKVLWQDVAAVFVVANLICLLATIPPAVKASRMDPVGAIRHE